MANRSRSRSPRGGNDFISDLIVQREQARHRKDWAAADSIRDDLLAQGVTISDKTNSWKSEDGRTGRIPAWHELGLDLDDAGRPPVKQPPMPPQRPAQRPTFGGKADAINVEPVSGETAQIKQLVEMREKARASKDFDQADSLRDELQELGVEVHDKEKIWRSKSGQLGIIVGYGSTPTEMEIGTLVAQREKFRQSGDYASGDLIRDELKAFGVEIKDKDKVWRTSDGRSGPVPTWGAVAGEAITGGRGGVPVVGRAAPMMVQRVQAPTLMDYQNQVVQAALMASQTPAMAIRTLQLLRMAGAGQPMALGGMSAAPPPARPAGRASRPAPTSRPALPTPPSAPPSKATPDVKAAMALVKECESQGRSASDTEIDWLVTTRERMRQASDYSASDRLRDALNALGVELSEKEKTWRSADGRMGQIPLWSDIA